MNLWVCFAFSFLFDIRLHILVIAGGFEDYSAQNYGNSAQIQYGGLAGGTSSTFSPEPESARALPDYATQSPDRFSKFQQ